MHSLNFYSTVLKGLSTNKSESGCVLLLLAIFSYSSLIAQPFLERQIFQGPHNHNDDRFGSSFFVSNDYLVVGAMDNNSDVNGGNVINRAGAVYTYYLDNDTIWEVSQKIISPHRFNVELFGSSIGLSDSVFVAGAISSDVDENQNNFLNNAGAVYIFSLNTTGIWSFTQKLTPGSRFEDDGFGDYVAIADDVIVGSTPKHCYDSNNLYKKNAGSVFIFKKESANNFVETQHITPLDRDSADRFGWGLCLKNSDELFVGAPYQKGINYFEGAVYYFKRNSNGVWTETQKITAANRIRGLFGQSISAWGDYLCIGAPMEDLDLSGQNPIINAGGAYIFKKDQLGKYNQIQRILPPVREHEGNFGYKVSGSEEILVIGAPYSSTDANNQDSITFSGAVYVYLNDKNGQWQFSQKLVQTQRIKGNGFGAHVMVKDNMLISSAGQWNQFSSGTCTFYIRNDSIVGFKEVKSSMLFEAILFPNPSEGKFTLNAPKNKMDRMKIYDVNGRLVYVENLTGKESAEVILPENILNGLYLLRIESGREVVNKKLLVNGR